jgi:hypothetical protein
VQAIRSHQVADAKLAIDENGVAVEVSRIGGFQDSKASIALLTKCSLIYLLQLMFALIR